MTTNPIEQRGPLHSDSPDLDTLIAQVQADQWQVRAEAAAGLGRLRHADAVEPLLGLLEDNTDEVRAAAARALGDCNDPRAIEPLFRAVDDEWVPLRSAAATALGQIDGVADAQIRLAVQEAAVADRERHEARAREQRIAAADTRYVKKQPVWRFVLLCLVTLGLYELWFFYRTWRFLKERDDLDIRPFWRTFFTYFFVINLYNRVSDLARERGGSGLGSPTALGVWYIILSLTWKLPEPFFWITFLSIFVLIPVVNALNYYVEHPPIAPPVRAPSRRQARPVASSQATWSNVNSDARVEIVRLVGDALLREKWSPDWRHDFHGSTFDLVATRRHMFSDWTVLVAVEPFLDQATADDWWRRYEDFTEAVQKPLMGGSFFLLGLVALDLDPRVLNSLPRHRLGLQAWQTGGGIVFVADPRTGQVHGKLPTIPIAAHQMAESVQRVLLAGARYSGSAARV